MEQESRTEKYQQMRQLLNEKQWRQFLALEAKERGNIVLVAREAGVSKNTIKAGKREIATGERFAPGKRIRGAGGGRKKQEEHEPQGHELGETAISKRLHAMGFSLRANKKTIEGKGHEDRDAQFGHIKQQCEQFEAAGNPIISVDCKKKELIGTFKNNGWEWQAKGEETSVNVYDYLSLADGKAVPYGVYDLVHNQGFVNVGIDHDTAEFAVESIRRWWQQTSLLITADGGGSNAARSRLWKREMQRLANETGLSITVCHFPRGTSKWNKIEHRLFSYISINWRAKPLTSLETIIELISHTTSKQGLTVTAVKDSRTYPTGIQVSDQELASLHLVRNAFHGEWNYTFQPQEPPSGSQVI